MRTLCSMAVWGIVSIVATTSINAYGEVVCPDPISQKEREYSVDAKARIQRVIGIDLRAKTESTVKDILHDYPSADKIALSNAMISVTCEFVKASSVDDATKFQEIRLLRGDILRLLGLSTSAVHQYEKARWPTPSVEADMPEHIARYLVKKGKTASRWNGNCFPPPVEYLGKTGWRFVLGSATRIGEQYSCSNDVANTGGRNITSLTEDTICLEVAARTADPNAVTHCTTRIHAEVTMQRAVD